MVFEDFISKEELLGKISLKGRTMGGEIYNSSYSFVTTFNVPLNKFVSITNVGMESMRGQVNGVIALSEQHNFLDLLSYHCDINQQYFCKRETQYKDCNEYNSLTN
jgi:hypothetical protein